MATCSGGSSSRMFFSLLLHSRSFSYAHLPLSLLPHVCSSKRASRLLFATTQQSLSLPLQHLYQQRLLLQQQHLSPRQQQHSGKQQRHFDKQQRQHQRQQRQLETQQQQCEIQQQQQSEKQQQQQPYERQQQQQQYEWQQRHSEEQRQCEEQQQIQDESGKKRRVQERRGALSRVSGSSGSLSSSSSSIESDRNSTNSSFTYRRRCCSSSSTAMGALSLHSSSRSGIGGGSRESSSSSSREDTTCSSRSSRQNRGRSGNSSSQYSPSRRLTFCSRTFPLSSSSRKTRSNALEEGVTASTKMPALPPLSSSSLFGASLRNARVAGSTIPASLHFLSSVAAAAAVSSPFHYRSTEREVAAAVATAHASPSNGDTYRLPLLLQLLSFSTTTSAVSFSRNRPLLSLSLLLSAGLRFRSAPLHVSVAAAAAAADTLHHSAVAAASVSASSTLVSLTFSSCCRLSHSMSSFSTAAACFSPSTLAAVPSSRPPLAAAANNTAAKRGFSSSSSSSSLLFPSSAVAASSVAGAAAAPPSAAGREKQQFALSIEEALYAAKEANIYTTEELQKIILRSPSFSPDRSPVLLENMFSSVEADTPETFEEEWGALSDEEEEDAMAEGDVPSSSGDKGMNTGISTATAGAAERGGGPSLQTAGSLIPAAIVKAFNPSWIKTFTHEDREWKFEAEGRGTRKRAAAHVIIRLGSGQVRVNDNEDLYVRWPYYYNRMDVLQPLYLTNTATLYDVFICARGGGPSGQAAAARLAIGRALVDACPACQPDLEEDLVLYEDLRQRMPKMPGRMKARKTRAWTKR